MDLKERLKSVSHLPHIERVDCSDIWGDPDDVFYLRALPTRTFERYQVRAVKSLRGDETHAGLRAMLLAMSLCDEKGENLFDWTKREDIDLCDKIPMILANKLYVEAQTINVGDDKEVETLAKNSNSAKTDDSFSN